MTTMASMVTVREIVRLFIHGMNDLFVGVASIVRLDSYRTAEVSQMVVNDIQNFTVLALRREKQRQAKKKASAEASSSSGNRPKIVQRLIQCVLLNGGVCLLSLLLFQHVLLPGLQWALSLVFADHARSIWAWLQPLLHYTFGLFWVMPLLLLSRVVNCFWFQDIADQAFRLLGLKPAQSMFSNVLGDIIFSTIVQTIFLVQSQAIFKLPIYPLGDILGLLHLSLLNSYYTFEYKWYSMGYSLYKRLDWSEFNWAYHAGFGLPLAVITWLPESRLVGGCLFAILFPLVIVAGHVANPPTARTTYRIPFFRPSVYIANTIFLRFLSRLVNSNHQPHEQQQKQQQQHQQKRHATTVNKSVSERSQRKDIIKSW
ncbi:etoposide-induced protein 2.4 homolog isoform X1 [Varroa jacobsoni]|uniref:etoposide-induced protein 2.4 homolog isoform X1 n=1 Tax=Varroa jacobsoni TaxID=62625 RepID=UPI000BF8A293|nr:etoposide-induced protein 2.4 homolog isoform X1 [Varroa jacobsoni]XP_022709467.1 etoposide-induced protein 2.4 homolog isoform X1 [Varroa jacobsoni]XP_022709468.1 etoposide-induced protein 2.4 homolog isoform X1 [Varroa jacobsoni]XP_022709470.1 etoposide-induced protein 2.4 homolog isoform X1 [Varroa jacobsoni]